MSLSYRNAAALGSIGSGGVGEDLRGIIFGERLQEGIHQ